MITAMFLGAALFMRVKYNEGDPYGFAAFIFGLFEVSLFGAWILS